MSEANIIERLRAGHRGLEATAAQLDRLLDSAVPDRERLAAVRWDFATKVMQHLALEDRHVYANLAESRDASVAAIGRRYQEEYAAYLQGYEAHARHWTSDRVVAEWPTYRAATREQLKLLHARMAKVERELYPLAKTSVSVAEARSPSRSWTREAFKLKASIAP